ncbi:MAG TPA: threonine/serine dehydratase [Candidatus Limnocylindrales bacterium]|nr:threonine/serine dehydratase [Candidatus Limnocylindrales bacterium]
MTPILLAEIEAARARIEGIAIRTPLVPLNVQDGGPRILLKLENLQPIGSFKIRGAANAMAVAGREALADGVYTASAGNMAQGVAWGARRLGIRCRVVVPESAPLAKTAAVERLGGEVIRVPFDEWWQTMLDHGHPDIDGLFIHPFADPAVMAGNGTIGLEILEDAPDVEAIVVPYGGGGLSSGIASALRAIKPDVRVYAAEVETAAPFAASLAQGSPATIDSKPSFVDGIGGKGVFAGMWPLTSKLLAGSLVVSLAEIAVAIRLLAERNHVVAEGAGAAPVAAALNRTVDAKTIVCVVSGGNIDLEVLAAILRGEVPTKEH